MLRFYDTSAALALAFAALAAPTQADPRTAGGEPCQLADGYAPGPAAYAAETRVCLATADPDAEALERSLTAFANRERERLGHEPLVVRTALNDAARAHALDMAARSYVAHDDLEGRGHLYRMRVIDRRMLASAAGANIVMAAHVEPGEAFRELILDDQNRRNLMRDRFTHMGVGAAIVDGKAYIVQLFAEVDGELETPLPVELPRRADLEAEFADAGLKPLGWRLEAQDGRTLASGPGERTHAGLEFDQAGYLEVAVERDLETLLLKGPIVEARGTR